MPVLDTSAALELLLKTPRGLRATAGLLNSDHELHAPYLLDIEFLHVLKRLWQRRQLDQQTAQRAIDDLSDLQLFRHPHNELLVRIWGLRSSLSAYDAAYVALAESLEMPLFTFDAKLAHSHGHRAKIVLLS